MSRLLTPVRGAEVYLFAAPDTKSPRLYTIRSGDIVKTLEENTEWAQVYSMWGASGWAPLHMMVDIENNPIEVPEFYLSWPTDYTTVTQGYNLHPEWYNKWGLPGHEGIDIQAPMYSNIYACAPGEVTAVIEEDTGHNYGNHIRIKHEDSYQTIYAHLSTFATGIVPGVFVYRKQLIGTADSTGNSTGSHLHLTLKKLGATARGETNFPNDIINPEPFLVKD